MHNQYFEGTLQLRNPTDEIIRFIREDVKKSGVFISKEIKLKKGIDFYISSQRFLRNLGIKLKKRFGGQLKMSRRIYSVSRVTSKSIYRVTVLFRPIPFKCRDIIIYRGEQVRIKSIGKKVSVQNIKTGKRFQIDFDDILS